MEKRQALVICTVSSPAPPVYGSVIKITGLFKIIMGPDNAGGGGDQLVHIYEPNWETCLSLNLLKRNFEILAD